MNVCGNKAIPQDEEIINIKITLFIQLRSRYKHLDGRIRHLITEIRPKIMSIITINAFV